MEAHNSIILFANALDEYANHYLGVSSYYAHHESIIHHGFSVTLTS